MYKLQVEVMSLILTVSIRLTSVYNCYWHIKWTLKMMYGGTLYSSHPWGTNFGYIGVAFIEGIHKLFILGPGFLAVIHEVAFFMGEGFHCTSYSIKIMMFSHIILSLIVDTKTRTPCRYDWLHYTAIVGAAMATVIAVLLIVVFAVVIAFKKYRSKIRGPLKKKGEFCMVNVSRRWLKDHAAPCMHALSTTH